jgi:hypothetical protein
MSKVEMLVQLPKGALSEIASWLEVLSRITEERQGWLKEDYVEKLARKLDADQVRSLNGCVRSSAPYFSENDLIRLFGLPPKTVIASWLTRDELRGIMQRLDANGEVHMAWRSLSATELQDYLIRKLSAEELALKAGLIKRRYHKVETRPRDVETSAIMPDARSIPIAPTPKRDGVLMRIHDVIAYLAQGEFVQELLGSDHLGETEATFQAVMFNLIKRRLGEPFRIECNPTLDDNKRPDIVIRHVQGQIAFEIKPNGSLQGLLIDIAKLRRYLRRDSAEVMFGFMVYRSTRTEHPEVLRAISGESRLLLLRIPA